MARTRVTLDDVAEASEASSAAVSLALRNKPGVSRETRERIVATAHALGYQRPNRTVPSDGVAVRNIALIFRTWSQGPERSSPALNPFYSWVLTGIQETAALARMNMLLGTIPVDSANTTAHLSEHLLDQPLDGVLLVGSLRPETIADVLDLVGDPAPPIVLVDSDDRTHELDTVSSDNTRGGEAAAETLLSLGHRALSYVGPVSTWEPNFRERLVGFRIALADRQLAPMHVIESDLADISREGVVRLLGSSTGVVCGNDDVALWLLRMAGQLDVRIPDDVSVIGFDDTTAARHAQPPLTTMAVDKITMGRMAVQLLDHRIDWPDAAPIHLSMTPRLVRRESDRTRSATAAAG